MAKAKRKAKRKAPAAAARPDRQANGRFAKGRAKTGGRTRDSGYLALVTREAVLDALEGHAGGVTGYAKYLMAEHPRAFVALWRDQVPKVLEIEDDAGEEERTLRVRWAAEAPADA